MKILENVEIVDLGLLVGDSLVFSDFHLGYEQNLSGKGVLVPRFQFKDTISRLNKIFEIIKSKKINVDKIIINGDIKHEFGKITEQEWREVLQLIDYLQGKKDNEREVIIVKGNHDNAAKYIAEKRDVEIVDFYTIGDVLILHGDVIPVDIGKNVKTLIIGHEHPAVSLRESEDAVRSEVFKCFLKGKWKMKNVNEKNLIVTPSFNLVTEGSDVRNHKLLSPFLKLDTVNLDNFEVFVVADEVRYFGKVGELS
jgi:uncharacterized protein